MSNVIQEYLVRLGYQPDEPAFRHFESALGAADRAVERHATGILKWTLAVPTGVVAAFGSITAATAGMLNQVAQADQGYRLMGLRMLMTTESARKLDMITKALGADLPSIIWDRELHERAELMGQDIDRMMNRLGPGFEDSMKGIRDFRFELSRVEVGLKFLAMNFAQDVFRKLFPGRDAITTLREWVTTFQDKLPDLSSKLANFVVPVMRTTWEMAKSGGHAIRALGWAFTELVAYFAHDDSIRGKAFDFERFGKAVAHVGQGVLYVAEQIPRGIEWITTKFEEFMRWLPGFRERVGIEFEEIRASIVAALRGGGEAMAHFSRALADLSDMNFKGASAEFHAMAADVEKAVGSFEGTQARVSRRLREREAQREMGGAIADVASGNVATGILGMQRALQMEPGKESAPSATPKATDSRSGQARTAGEGVPPWIKGVIERSYLTPDDIDQKTGLKRIVKSDFESWGHYWRRITEGRGVSGLWDYTRKSSEEMMADRDLQAEGREPAKSTPGLSLQTITEAITAAAAEESRRAGVHLSSSLALAVARRESNFKQDAHSRKGAIGIMQLEPGTAKDLHVDPNDPAQNIVGGARYLVQLLKRYGGDEAKALAAYNAGPSRVDPNQPLDLSKLPAETQGYVPSVLRFRQEIEEAAAKRAKKDAQPAPAGPAAALTLPEISRRDFAPALAAAQLPRLPEPQQKPGRDIQLNLGEITVVIAGSTNMGQPELARAVKAGFRDAFDEKWTAALLELAPLFR